MLRTAFCRCLIPLAFFALAPLAAFAQTTAFNLPAQPLAESLKAVGSQTGLNIMVSPPLVDGKQAPPLKANLSAKDALARLLVGTKLEYHFVNDQTVVIRDAQPLAANDPPPLQPTNPPTEDHSKEAGKTTSQDFRVAQVGRAAAGPRVTEQTKAEPRKSVLEEIVVTGSHISGKQSVSPVLDIDRSAIDQSGFATTDELMRSVPQVFSGNINPGVVGARGAIASQNLGAGAASVDLRGLGPGSTLTLVDGYRLAYDGFAFSSDISGIPLAAIDHVEILTDGASSVYGSDAVAGVVNFVLRKNFSGAETTMHAGATADGGAGQLQFGQLLGTTWSSGSALINYDYFDQNALRAYQRDFTSTVGGNAQTTLIPEFMRNSFFGRVTQDFGDMVSANIEGMYTHRTSESATFSSGTTNDFLSTTTELYAVPAEVTLHFDRGWSASINGEISQSRDNQNTVSVDYSSGLVAPIATPQYVNRISSGEIHASGPILSLPSGDIKIALGGGRRSEYFSSTSDDIAVSRSINYAFSELRIPLADPSQQLPFLRSLELSASGRFEDYSDVGSSTTPKVAFSYSPGGGVTLRGSWAKTLRAPPLEFAYTGLQFYPNDADLLFGTHPAGSQVVILFGGNNQLKPERAISRTIGLDYKAPVDPALQLGLTYFDIDYQDRITNPIDQVVNAFTNPAYAPFVTSNPSAALLAALRAQSSYYNDSTTTGYDPSKVIALIENNYQNAAVQRIDGVDLTGKYAMTGRYGRITVAGDGAWLRFRQMLTVTSPIQTLSGTIFNPPRFKGRISLDWQRRDFDATLIGNYVSSEIDDTGTSSQTVASWTTFDARAAYKITGVRFLGNGLTVAIAAQNILNRAPPFVNPASTTTTGIQYDSANSSALGRFVSLTLSEAW